MDDVPGTEASGMARAAPAPRASRPTRPSGVSASIWRSWTTRSVAVTISIVRSKNSHSADLYRPQVQKRRVLPRHQYAVGHPQTLITEIGALATLRAAWSDHGLSRGSCPARHSSGPRNHKGSITKAGNSRCRHVLVQAAWHYRHRPAVGVQLEKRQRGQPPGVIAHGWKAQHRSLQDLSPYRTPEIVAHRRRRGSP